MTRYMAIDQYGETIHGLTRPRRDLLKACGRKSAAKMYIDTKGGATLHIGYIVAGRWFAVYKVERMERPA